MCPRVREICNRNHRDRRLFLTPMSELLPILVEKSIQIAWDFLERSGEITDPGDASRFLLRNIDDMARAGEHRPLMLANHAIDAYRRYKRLLAA